MFDVLKTLGQLSSSERIRGPRTLTSLAVSIFVPSFNKDIVRDRNATDWFLKDFLTWGFSDSFPVVRSCWESILLCTPVFVRFIFLSFSSVFFSWSVSTPAKKAIKLMFNISGWDELFHGPHTSALGINFIFKSLLLDVC